MTGIDYKVVDRDRLGHSTRPCIFSVFRGHIHNCVNRV